VKFQTEHLATLAKYAGISFVAGAVNHGFFSERRSFVTAGVGVLCFLIGAAMEMKAAPDGSKRWADLLGFGIVASVGLGFFTGGLQHFPDSPGRSLWVVPLGFFLSLGAVYLSEGRSRIAPKPLAVYTLATGVSVIAGSVLAASYWGQLGSQFGGDGHDHDHGAVSAVAAPPAASPSPAGEIRNVVVEVDDSRRIVPDKWQARQGEPVRLIVVNTGQSKHELLVGPANELGAHAQSMSEPAGGQHGHANAVSVEPGQSAIMLLNFDAPGEWGMACLEPGHYEGGMKGVVDVAP
jgi:uncharacterized cupredoxin-like copper-binding protein